MSRPYVNHLKATYQVLSYIKGTVGQGLLFPKELDLKLKGYGDAN